MIEQARTKIVTNERQARLYAQMLKRPVFVGEAVEFSAQIPYAQEARSKTQEAS